MSEIRALQPRDPRHIGPYEVTGRIGAGGMGVVYLAWRDARPVAVKVMRDELADDERFRVRFAREVEVLSRIAGHCTAQVLDADPAADPPYLVTEYVPGPSLAEHVAAYGPLPAQELHALAAGLAEALQAVHAAGVVHRDLKPSNVLLAAGGPKVIDFGIAQVADATALTSSTTRLGSPGYLAPEQVRGEQDEAAGDVFTWGATVAFAATGRSPFGAGATDAVLYRVLNGPADLAGWPDDALPLRELVERALDKQPERRPRVDDLLAGLLGGHVTADRPADQTTALLLERTWRLPVRTTASLPAPRTLSATSHAGGRRWAKRMTASVTALALGFAIGTISVLASDQPTAPGVRAAGTADPEPTPLRTTAPTASPAATLPPVPTQAPPPPSPPATDVVIYNPHGGAVGADVRVVHATTGSCWGSGHLARSEAFRCSLDTALPDGGNLLDPCFIDPFTYEPVLLCPVDVAAATMVELDAYDLSAPNDPIDDPIATVPFLLELDDGTICDAMTGATGTVSGMRLNFACRGADVYGDLDRSGRAWRVYVQRDGASGLQQEYVRRAWM